MINMLRALVAKVDNMKEQTCNVSRRRNQKKILESKNSVTEIKNVFDVLISILAIAIGKIISEFENRS